MRQHFSFSHSRPLPPTLIKGAVVGASMLVPGMSGGTTALLLGIYDQLIAAVSSFGKNPRGNLFFLGVFLLGGVGGMLLFAQALLRLVTLFPQPMLYLFLGAILGGLPLMFSKAQVNRNNFHPALLLYLLLGMGLVWVLAYLPPNLFQFPAAGGLRQTVVLLLTGVVAAVALVLPGISVSYLLLIIGVYHPTLSALSQGNIGFLLPLALGVFLGVICTTRLLEQAMVCHPQGTYLLIAGFVLGSLGEVFPGIPHTTLWLPCLLTFLLGLGLVGLLARRYA